MPSHAKSANFLICWLVLRDTGREQVTAQGLFGGRKAGLWGTRASPFMRRQG